MLATAFDYASLVERKAYINQELLKPEVYQNLEKSTAFSKELASIEKITELIERTKSELEMLKEFDALYQGIIPEEDKESFEKFVVKVFNECGIKPDFGVNIMPRGVHIDVISEKLIVVNNASEKDIKIHLSKECKGIFFDVVPDNDGNVTLPPHTVEMFSM